LCPRGGVILCRGNRKKEKFVREGNAVVKPGRRAEKWAAYERKRDRFKIKGVTRREVVSDEGEGEAQSVVVVKRC